MGRSKGEGGEKILRRKLAVWSKICRQRHIHSPGEPAKCISLIFVFVIC